MAPNETSNPKGASIRTPDQRLRVFVSSTLGELADEREAAREAICALRLTPVMFELGARPHPPAEVYRDYLSQSHVFVGIYGESYGWVAPGAEVSGIEEELTLAAGMPRLLYVAEPSVDRDPRLAAMIAGIEEAAEITYRTFASASELGRKIGEDLALLLSDRFEASVRHHEFKTRSDPDRSIAVLPFVNLSGDPENEYFSDGVTETILTTLSRMHDLKVISRTSVMSLKGMTKSLRQIAHELGVAYLVEGAVQRSGGRVRITAQLIDGRDDTHLWAESYDRDLEDIFAIQSDVAERVVASLKAALTPIERARLEGRPTARFEAYERYLKGRHFMARRTAAELARAVDAFRKAVEVDPRFAQAWAGLSEAYALMLLDGDVSREETGLEALAAAEFAIDIDPTLGEPHASKGLVALFGWVWSVAERECLRAIELDPGLPSGFHRYGLTRLYQGHIEEAIESLKRALALDPLSLPIHGGLGVAYVCARRYDLAEEIYRKGLEIDPRSPFPYVNLALLYERQGRFEEAMNEAENAARWGPDVVDPELVASMRAGFAESGPVGYSRASLEWLEAREWTPSRALGIALSCATLGRLDEAFEHLERMVSSGDPAASEMAVDPRFDVFRSDPRFAKLLKMMNLDVPT